MLWPSLQGLMQQLAGDPSIVAMIAEMFFEQHFNAPEMRPHFKLSGINTTLSDVQQMFHSFRGRGLRLHYWP